MKTYGEIKKDYQKKVDDIITSHQVFFAFSQSQLEEGKKKIGITDNKDLTDIGAGGFCPKAKASLFANAMDEAEKEFKKELKEAEQAKEEAILYELNNYESFYRGNMDDVIEIFKGIYTKEEIEAVYKKFVNSPHKPEDRQATNIND